MVSTEQQQQKQQQEEEEDGQAQAMQTDEVMDCHSGEENGDEILAMSTESMSDSKFDITIGHIEDIIMDDTFNEMQNDFLEKYYKEFDDSDENKLEYTTIHEEYVEVIETYILEQLTLRMPGFDMEEFANQLMERQERGGDEMNGEIFEILLTFSDFMAFKEVILAYKAQKEGTAIDMSGGIQITSLASGEPSIGPNVHTVEPSFGPNVHTVEPSIGPNVHTVDLNFSTK